MATKLEQLEGLKIIELYNKLRKKHPAEVILQLYKENNIDGIWSIHLDDVELQFEVEDWMYAYAMSLQLKEQQQDYNDGKNGVIQEEYN